MIAKITESHGFIEVADCRAHLAVAFKFLSQLRQDADSSDKSVLVVRQMAEISSRGERGNGITIREAGDGPMPDAEDAEVDAMLAADIDYARQLQAKLDAEEARSGNRSALHCIFTLSTSRGLSCLY